MKPEKETDASHIVGLPVGFICVFTSTALVAANDHSLSGDLTLGGFMLSLLVFCPLTVWLFFIRSFGRQRRKEVIDEESKMPQVR